MICFAGSIICLSSLSLELVYAQKNDKDDSEDRDDDKKKRNW